MKKIVYLAIALMLCCVLCACDDDSYESPDYDDYIPSGTTKFDETTDDVDITTDDTVTDDTTADGTTADDTTAEETTSEETTAEETTEDLIDGMRPEFKEAMDAYEEFYDEYCEFMKEYNDNPYDFTLIAKYAELLITAEEMNDAFDEWDEDEMNDAELNYYLEVNSRVTKKLIDVAG